MAPGLRREDREKWPWLPSGKGVLGGVKGWWLRDTGSSSLLPTLVSGPQIPTPMRRTKNPSINSNRLGNRAIDPSDIMGSFIETIYGARRLLMMQAQEYLFTLKSSIWGGIGSAITKDGKDNFWGCIIFKIFGCETFFKVFIKFVMVLILCYILVFWPRGMWDPSFSTRDGTHTPYIGRWSLTHWTAREVPLILFL